MKCHARQFAERFAYVKIAQRRDLKVGHLVALCVQFCLFGGHLSLEGQMQTIAYQYFGHAGRMLCKLCMCAMCLVVCFVVGVCLFETYLFHLLQPSTQAVKTPLVGDVINQYDALRTARIRSDDGAEATLAGRVPDLQFDTLAVQQNCCGFVG